MSESLVQKEEADFEETVRSLEHAWSSPRFKHTKRPYGARQVAALRGTISETPASSFMAKKLYTLLRSSFDNNTYAHTFGALDTVQVIITTLLWNICAFNHEIIF